MIIEDRREQRRQQTHQQLLDAAREVFSQKGYYEASILDITEAANLSKRTFYLHFPDKESLIREIALRSFEEVRHQIESSKEHQSPDLEMNFRRMVEQIFEYAQKNADLMQIVTGREGSFSLNDMTREYFVQAFTENMAKNSTCIYIGEAIIPQIVMANAKAGVVFQVLCWWAQNPNAYTPAHMAEMCTEILFRGTAHFYQSGEEARDMLVNGERGVRQD